MLGIELDLDVIKIEGRWCFLSPYYISIKKNKNFV